MEKVYLFEAGILIRGALKRELTKYLTMKQLPYTIEENKGLIESLYRVAVTGTVDQHSAFERFCQQLEEALNA